MKSNDNMQSISETQFNRHPLHPVALVVIPACALVLMLVILGCRNIYEDEILSFAFIDQPSISAVWSYTNHTDIHPPGMYVLDKLALAVTGSYRWLAVLPTLVWFFGTWIFVASARNAFRTRWGAALFSAIAFMHPQILMWCTTLRWNSYFAGIGLITLSMAVLAHEPDGSLRKSVPCSSRCIVMGIGLATLFYLNYTMALFCICFSAAWIARHGYSFDSVKRLVLTGAVSVVGSLPQLSALFAYHLPQAQRQNHFKSLTHSAARILHGATVGEAMLPLAPIAVIIGFFFIVPNSFSALRSLITQRRNEDDRSICVRTIAAFFFAGIACAIFSGLGASPRNFCYLSAAVGFLLAIGAETIPHRAWHFASSVLVALWIGLGAHNMILRTGTAKGGFNDHYEEIVQKIVQLTEGKSAVIVLYNANLDFEFNELRLKNKLPIAICSETPDCIHQIERGFQGDVLAFERVIVIENYPFPEGQDPMIPLLAEAKSAIGNTIVSEMGYDPDYQMKSLLSRQAIPPNRFKITSGDARNFDWKELSAKLAELSAIRDRHLKTK